MSITKIFSKGATGKFANKLMFNLNFGLVYCATLVASLG
jgi:hypothetical protein